MAEVLGAQSSQDSAPFTPPASGSFVSGEEKAAMIQKVKQEVKRLMEEAVTRKFIHEDSSSVRSLCAVVDQCLVHKLKKGVLSSFSIGGLWNSPNNNQGKSECSASLSLVSKLCKQLPDSEIKQQLSDILCQVQDKQNAYKIMMKNSNVQNGAGSVSWSIQEFPSERALKFLWMRLSLFSGILDRVIDFICKESSKYYDKESFMCDPVVTTLLISLMVGPCSLDYSKAKTPDHLWTDPHAEELVLKHRIHSDIGYTSSQFPMDSSSPKGGNSDARRALFSSSFKSPKPALTNIETGGHKLDDTNSSRSQVSPAAAPQLSVDSISPISLAHSPKDYVDSLHQNNKETLIYGKNNVKVQPTSELEPMLGYLSLHQSTASPTIVAAAVAARKAGKDLNNSAYSTSAAAGVKQVCWLQLQWTPNDVMSPVPVQISAATIQSSEYSRITKAASTELPHVNGVKNNQEPNLTRDEKGNHASSSSTGKVANEGSVWTGSNHGIDRDALWKYAMSVDMRDILYLHCHQMCKTLIELSQNNIS